MIPLAAAAFGSQALGSVLGGIGSSQMIDSGLRQYKSNVNAGTNQLRQGMAGAQQAFDPYQSAGAQGSAGQLAAIQGRTMAPMPTLSNVDPTQAAQFLSPQAAYQQGQAMKSSMAAAGAGGGFGGGMLKALQTNANKLAQGSWNDAYSNMLNTANLNFGQQQQQFQNKTGYDQSQIENWGGLANRGLQAVGQNQGLQLGYNQGINANYGDIANAANAAATNKGNLWNNTAQSLGNLGANAFNFFAK